MAAVIWRASLIKDFTAPKASAAFCQLCAPSRWAASAMSITLMARPPSASYSAPSTTNRPRPSTLPTETGWAAAPDLFLAMAEIWVKMDEA